MAAAALAWLWLTGLGMAHRLMPAAAPREKLALAFPLSAGLHGLFYFILLQCCRGSVWWSLLPFAPFLPAGVLALKSLRPLKPSLRDAAPLAFILLSLVRVGVHLIVVPARESDSIAMWIFKGKAIHLEGALTAGLMSYLGGMGLHPEYPWNVPMMHAWMAGVLGGFSETASKWILLVFFASLLGILYAVARLRWPRSPALLFLAAYLAVPMVLQDTFNRDADMILETLIAGALLLMVKNQPVPRAGGVFLTGAYIFLACWTKIEGLAFAGLLFLLLALAAWRERSAAGARLAGGALASSLAGFLAFWIPKQVFEAPTMFKSGVAPLSGLDVVLARAAAVAGGMLSRMADVGKWNLAWLLIPALLIAGREDRFGLRFILLGQMAVYAGVYFLTPHDLAWHMRTSLPRIMLHLVPALFAWSVFALPGTKDH